MTKVVIVNTTHFANKGSMGRIEGIISCLERTIPQVQITILHRYYKKDKDSFVKQLIEEHPNLEVKEHPWFIDYDSNIITAMSSTVRFCLLTTWHNIFRKLGLPLKDELQRCNVIIDLNLIEPNEGIYFTMTVGDFFALLNTWYTTMTGKPVMVCSATIGPYKGRFLRYLASYVLNKVDIITLREEYSQNYLSTLGVTKPRIYLSADLAFLLKPADTERILAILGSMDINMDEKPIVGIAPTAMMHPLFKQQQYVQLMTELSDYLIKDLNATIIYITHTYQDKPITESIYQQVKNKHTVRILPSLSASEIKGVIGMCDIFICSRFHALVASTSLAVPSLGIVAYSKGKFHGIIGEMMGQENYLLDVDNEFEYDVFSAKLKSKVSDLLIHRNLIAENLKERTKIAEERALLNGKLIKELIDSNH
ncbi:MAG: polysaccharide pyruvyl transferase family protein [Candidatus Methanoperedens sp.]